MLAMKRVIKTFSMIFITKIIKNLYPFLRSDKIAVPGSLIRSGWARTSEA